jgi:hypothetical protein
MGEVVELPKDEAPEPPKDAPSAQRLIRSIAADSARVFVVPHGKKRQRKRNVSTKQVIDCLLKGTISEGPYLTSSGETRCNVRRHAAGEELTCVVEFDLPRGLLIVTVYAGG